MSKILIFMSVLLGIANGAFAGNWISGGGELSSDNSNPWFIENTLSASYCIDMDDANFGQTRAVAGDSIRRALAVWKEEFLDADYIGVVLGHAVQMASQNFYEVPCTNKNVDIRFQFGVWTKEQQAKLGDPTRFVSMAVRTDYDRVQMRGKGFIYVSPSHGPLRFKGDNIAANPWQLQGGSLLYATLLHELGHVFGIKHSANLLDLMGANFLENLVVKGDSGLYAIRWKKYPKPGFFKFSGDPENPNKSGKCLGANEPGQPDPRREFFGSFDYLCVTVQNFVLTAWDGDPDLGGRIIGRAELKRQKSTGEASAMIWLPREQQVFRLNQPGYEGPGEWIGRDNWTRLSGTYESNDGKIKHPIFVESMTARVGTQTVGGVVNGNLYFDILSHFRIE